SPFTPIEPTAPSGPGAEAGQDNITAGEGRSDGPGSPAGPGWILLPSPGRKKRGRTSWRASRANDSPTGASSTGSERRGAFAVPPLLTSQESLDVELPSLPEEP